MGVLPVEWMFSALRGLMRPFVAASSFALSPLLPWTDHKRTSHAALSSSGLDGRAAKLEEKAAEARTAASQKAAAAQLHLHRANSLATLAATEDQKKLLLGSDLELLKVQLDLKVRSLPGLRAAAAASKRQLEGACETAQTEVAKAKERLEKLKRAGLPQPEKRTEFVARAKLAISSVERSRQQVGSLEDALTHLVGRNRALVCTKLRIAAARKKAAKDMLGLIGELRDQWTLLGDDTSHQDQLLLARLEFIDRAMQEPTHPGEGF